MEEDFSANNQVPSVTGEGDGPDLNLGCRGACENTLL